MEFHRLIFFIFGSPMHLILWVMSRVYLTPLVRKGEVPSNARPRICTDYQLQADLQTR